MSVPTDTVEDAAPQEQLTPTPALPEGPETEQPSPSGPSGDDTAQYPAEHCQLVFEHMSMHEMVLTAAYLIAREGPRPEHRALAAAIRRRFLTKEMHDNIGCLDSAGPPRDASGELPDLP